MKKQIILILLALTGGFALPASAQTFRQCAPVTEIFISGYHACGTPIYAKRIRYGRSVQVVPLTGWELRRYHERQRQLAIARQREYQRLLAQQRLLQSRRFHNHPHARFGHLNQRRCW
jgi:hypothetical protein